jgi:hypothetical protein
MTSNQHSAWLFLSLLFLASGALISCRRADAHLATRRERGSQIVAEYRRRVELPNRHARIQLTIASSDEAAKVYELDVWRKQSQDQVLTLTHVVEPEDERDLGVLTIEPKNQPAVNITYAQSSDRFYESGTNHQAFGSLTTQDFLGQWDKYDFRLLSEKEIEGSQAYEVEGKPKPGFSSPVARIVTTFRADLFMPALLRVFNSQGQEIQTFHIREYRTIDGQPTIWRMEIETGTRRTRILFEALSLNLRDAIDDRVFTRENLKRLVSR